MIKFTSDFAVTEAEKQAYIEYVQEHDRTGQPIEKIELRLLDNDEVDIIYTTKPVKFERIRRITGYLTGTVDRWGDGKRAELQDRVKHG